WVELTLATPVILWCGWPFLLRGGRSFISMNLNMFSLIGIGVAAAYAFSVFAVIAPGLFPAGFKSPTGHVGVYFESAAVIVELVLLGQLLELGARDRTGSAIRALMGLTPQTANLIDTDGTEKEIPLDKVKVGDQLRVKPGGMVPVDGVVFDGWSSVNESMLTGEPIPVERTSGDIVRAGTINGSGTFLMNAQRVGLETVLSQIITLTVAAQRSRAPIQKVADAVAGIFVPIVILVSIISFLAWANWGPEPRLSYALVSALAVLIIACPCAIGLATPMSIMTATGRGAQSGVLVKDAEALERFSNIDTLVVDKTGTLTEGKPVVTNIYPANGFNLKDIIFFAASLENQSEHPLAAAITARAKEQNLQLSNPQDFTALPGRGVIGRVEGSRVVLGTKSFLSAEGIPFSESLANNYQNSVHSEVMVAVDGKLAGIIAISDPIKASTPRAIRELQTLGIRVVMATGDNINAATSIARRLGIDEVHAELLPEGKIQLVSELKTHGLRVAMAGDGINDAPALASADVGIAMGTGVDVAIESASITLAEGDLMGVVRARNLAIGTMANIRQNLFFALFYNAAGVPIAAGILYPFFGIMLSPMLAAAAMSLSSVCVITNALRLRKIRLQ
ncbi:MAG: copper-translocating P-type ATPase, partial [Alphaproteobacteria bacterium]